MARIRSDKRGAIKNPKRKFDGAANVLSGSSAMKVAKKYIAYMTVLGMAGAAWGIDHAFFSPALASAVVVPSPEQPIAVASAAASSIDAAPASPNWLAERLRSAAGGSLNAANLRDAFSPSSRWVAEQRPTLGQREEQIADNFRHAHRVVAVMTDNKGGRALINDRILRVGQAIDGFQLVILDHRSAYFSGHGVQVTLPVGAGTALADAE